MQRLSLVGLMQMDLPARTVRLCDGGRIAWGASVFRGTDDVFGVFGGFEELKEGVGEELPVLDMTLIPAGTSTPADVNSDTFQASRVRFWTASYDPETGAVTGTPDLQFDGQLDQTILTTGTDQRELQVTVTPTAERLLLKSEGNSLSPTFHKAIWAGETGHDDASGLTLQDAWGTESPQLASTRTGLAAIMRN